MLRAVAPAAAAASAFALPLAAAAAPPRSTRLVNVRADPGNFIQAGVTVDTAGDPAFVFGSDIPPASATAYTAQGQVRWSFFNKSAGDAIKEFQATVARHCESGGRGAGAVDVWVTETDTFNDASFTVFGLSSSAASATPVWTLPFVDCDSDDGGFTVKASDRGDRVAVQCTASGVGTTVFGVNGQTGAVEWRYNTTNPLSGTDNGVQISSSGAYVLVIDAYAPDTPNNATVLLGATGEVRDASIPLPYYSSAAAISDSGNYVAVVDEIAINVYKWNAKRGAYALAYVLPPPAGGPAVTNIEDVVMSTGRDKDEAIVAIYSGDQPTSVAVGIWSLTDGTLQTSWSRAGAKTFGGLSADGEYAAAALEDGAVLLVRGSNDALFSFKADVMLSVSVNVVPAPGGGDTVFLAAAGGNNGAGGSNTGDAFGYKIEVPAAAAPPTPCFGTLNNDEPVEEVCFTTLLNSSTTAGLSVREYPAGAATLVSYNVSALYTVSTFESALTLAGFGVIEYFIGGFNKKKENLLDARTVPFLVLPPAAAGGWVGRLALAPSKWPAGSKPPAPVDNVTLVPLAKDALTLAVQFVESNTEGGPTGDELAALCARTATAVAAGALPGWRVDAASPFAAGVYALFYGRDAPDNGPFAVECWLGVTQG